MPTDRNPLPPDLTDEAVEATEASQKKDIDEHHEVDSGNNGGYSEGFKEVLHPHDALAALDDLALSERRYRRLFEAARDGILLLDVDTGHIIDANPYVYELLGYPPGALLGKELYEIGLFKDQKASQDAFQRLHTEGYIRYEDLPLENLNGETREVEFVSNVYRENGHTVIQCNIRDITARKRVEHALEAALARELHITDVLQHPLTMGIAEDAFQGLLVATAYEPAMKEAEVGGDFFDAFTFQTHKKAGVGRTIDTDMVALAVGDVMGKGLDAAVLARRVKDLMRAFLCENHDPAQTLARLNDYLCNAASSIGYRAESGNDMDRKLTMLTLSIAMINPQTGATAIACAGSEPPAVLRASGSVEAIETRGLLLGIEPGISYTIHWLHLRPGDTLLMVTDGITEARRSVEVVERATDEALGLLGYEGMLTIAHGNLNALSMLAMSQGILKEARAFGDGFRDDVCLLLARRR